MLLSDMVEDLYIREFREGCIFYPICHHETVLEALREICAHEIEDAAVYVSTLCHKLTMETMFPDRIH
eukprot:gene525-biopygen3035